MEIGGGGGRGAPEARGSSSPSRWRPGEGPWGWAVTGPASGGVGVCDSGAVWVSGGEVTGGRVLLAALLSALKSPAPSPYVLFLLWFRECGRLWRLRGAGLNLNAQLVRQGVAGGRPQETCRREPRARNPPPQRLPLQVISAPPPSHPAGLGCPWLPPLVWGKWRNRGRGSGRAV